MIPESISADDARPTVTHSGDVAIMTMEEAARSENEGHARDLLLRLRQAEVEAAVDALGGGDAPELWAAAKEREPGLRPSPTFGAMYATCAGIRFVEFRGESATLRLLADTPDRFARAMLQRVKQMLDAGAYEPDPSTLDPGAFTCGHAPLDSTLEFYLTLLRSLPEQDTAHCGLRGPEGALQVTLRQAGETLYALMFEDRAVLGPNHLVRMFARNAFLTGVSALRADRAGALLVAAIRRHPGVVASDFARLHDLLSGIRGAAAGASSWTATRDVLTQVRMPTSNDAQRAIDILQLAQTSLRNAGRQAYAFLCRRTTTAGGGEGMSLRELAEPSFTAVEHRG